MTDEPTRTVTVSGQADQAVPVVDATTTQDAVASRPDPVIPVAAEPVLSPVAPQGPDRMDGEALKELVQMVSAMAFVLFLLAIGWHAAHYSGAWPY